MRKLLLPAALLLTTGLMAQQPFCHTTEMQNEWFAANPHLKARFDDQQEAAAAADREMYRNGYGTPANISGRSMAGPSYTIPVVFHILHKGSSENISDAQVKDAVSILTRDFNKMNADTNDVVAAFKNGIGNAEISFVLATKDPGGNCTNGILRHFDDNTDWKNSFSNYKYSWPANKYLNIYVVRSLGGGAAGYTYLPGSGVPGAADAIVILSTYVGSIGTGNAGTSRALTHEVGHWLNLPHTWGGTNQPGVACGDDGVSDTPVTKGFTSCNLSNAAICNPSVVENMQNYMDYAYCQRMFTPGQAARMKLALNSSIGGRSNLSTPSNLLATGVTNPLTACVPLVDIAVAGNFTVCAGKSLSMNSFTSNANPVTYAWAADNGAQVQNSNAASPSITFMNQGVTNVTCVVSNSFGSSTATLQVTVKQPWADITSMYSESFESYAPQLPPNWSASSSTPLGWKNTINAASDGLNSKFVQGELLPAGEFMVLETPAFDFLSNPGSIFSFKYAYRKETSSTNDKFILQASSDCGGSWVNVYFPSSTQLAQNSGGVGTVNFEPTAEQWKLYDQVTSHPMFVNFLTEPNVKFRFYFEADPNGSGYGNRLFLDEINFSTPVGTNDLTRETSLNVFPNPSGSAFNVMFNLHTRSDVSYTVLSVAGAEVRSGQHYKMDAGQQSILINQDKGLSPGIYFLNLSVNGTVMSRKIVVQ